MLMLTIVRSDMYDIEFACFMLLMFNFNFHSLMGEN